MLVWGILTLPGENETAHDACDADESSEPAAAPADH